MVTYDGAVMSKSAAARQVDDAEWREYTKKLGERQPGLYVPVKEARAAIDKCLGDRPLTDILYSDRKERPL